MAVAAALSGCSDGATRIAFDIESGVAAFKSSRESRHTIRHVPEASPGGCDGAYKVQLSTALVIWCKDPASPPGDNGRIASSHLTSYHNRFVDVPQTFIIDKAAGEPLFIDLEKRGGKVVAVALR